MPYSPGTNFIERKAGSGPVATDAYSLELFEYFISELVFPLPNHLHEFFSADLLSAFTGLGEYFFLNYRLGRDPCMVSARHPERIEALHSLCANQNILKNVI